MELASHFFTQGDLRNVCQHPPSAREFANKFLYDLLSAAILAFAAEPSSCAAEFRDGTRFEFHYRCTEAGEDSGALGGGGRIGLLRVEPPPSTQRASTVAFLSRVARVVS